MNRPILPALPHARGRRPYVFRGQYFGTPVPGVIAKGDRMLAAVDAAWIFSELPLVSPQLAAPLTPAEALLFAPGRIPLPEFQAHGVGFLAFRDYAILADEMGLGKTVQALLAAELRLSAARGAALTDPHVLILCPALAKRHWQREIRKWTGFESTILEGLTAGDLPQTRYVIANYDIVIGQRRKDAAGKMHAVENLGGWGKVLAAAKFPIVICDEAHLLRGEKTKRTEAVKGVCADSTCVWLLTGTPMPNRVRDLWALWDLCSKGLAGYFWPFAKAYCGAYKSEYGWVADGQSQLPELGKRLSFFMLGRTKAAVALQLPEKRREVVTIDVGKFERPPRTLDEPARHERTNRVAAAMRATAKAKQPAIVEMANEAIAGGQKVVIFCYLRQQVDDLAAALNKNGTRVIPVHGESSPATRDAAAEQFRETRGACVFVATIDSVGIAISLVGADLVIFADLSYEPHKLLQAEARAHRYGSTTRVLIRYVVAAGSIDEALQEAVIEKLSVIEATLGGVADGSDLAVRLGKDVSTTEQILDRLFTKLTGG